MSSSKNRAVVVPTYTAAQVRTAELPYLDAGVPLMLRASTALAEVICDMIEWPEHPDDVRILFLVGSGNNGGDALFAAAQLARKGARVFAMPVGQKWHADALIEAQYSGVRLIHPAELEELSLDEFPVQMIVDGILGTGTSSNPALRGPGRQVVETISSTLDPTVTKVVAVDIPSGLHPVTGESDGVVLPADATVTFGCLKQGLGTKKARSLVGKIILADIGIGDELAKLDPVGEGKVAQILDARNLALPNPHLRPSRVGDEGDVLTAFLSNPDMERQGNITSLAEATEYVANLVDSDEAEVGWALVWGGRVVGMVGISADRLNENGWFYYWMADDARGRGWMKRAAATIANWALDEGGLYRLELGHRVNNPASGGVAHAAGFVKEGTERQKFLIGSERVDVDIYSRLKTDPVPGTRELELRVY